MRGLSAHGLRKATCKRLAEAGRSASDIAAVTGHAIGGVTYTVTVDDAYLLPGAQLLTPLNSDLRIVFDFVDDDGVTPRRFTEADDIDYPAFPSFSLLNGCRFLIRRCRRHHRKAL